MNILIPATIVIVAATAYRILEKAISSTSQSPFITASIIGAVEMIVALILWMLIGKFDASGVTTKSIWLAVATGVSVVAIDVGLLTSFFYGGDLAKITIWTGAGTVILLILAGLIFFNERLTWSQWIGIIFGIIGMYLIRP